MITVVDARREILLNPKGTNVWVSLHDPLQGFNSKLRLPQSGHQVQSLNSAAVTWSLAKQLYSPSGPYFVVPMGLFIGMVPTVIQYFIAKVSTLRVRGSGML